RTPAGATPPRGVAAARAADTGRTALGRGQADPQGTRPATPQEDPLSSGSFPSGAVNRGISPKNPLATGPVSGDPLDVTRVTGPFAASPGQNGSHRPQDGPAGPRRGRGGEPPSRQSWPAQPAYPAAGSYDILDGPEPAASGSNETWRAADYQMPSHDGGAYPARDAYPGETTYPGPASSYEVRPGWATIDDADTTVSAPTPSLGMPSAPARRGPETPEPRQDQSHGRQQGAAPGTTSGSWPRPPHSPDWPSYSELYGNGADEPSRATPSSRGGHHRVGDPEYPDYYR
ncbi:hypothetical protein, partial [Sphaerisporangium rubeum]